jgi:hypothetical protein
MKNTGKSLFSVVLQGVVVSGLLCIGVFSQRAYSMMPIGDEGVVAAKGWDMGMCRIPIGESNTAGVYFVTGETIDMPIHINNLSDSPDTRDIYISGSPVFTKRVEMGESRYTSGGTDKYADVMQCFLNGIYFDVPDSNIGDEAAVQRTIDRFRDSTAAAYKFEPNLVGCPNTTPFNSANYKCPAVQLEFFVQNDIGYVRITNNCAVRLMNPGPYDYNIVSDNDVNIFHTYKIYGYHYRPNGAANQNTVPITDTYVTQTIGGYTSDPAGQIFVNGNVIIGGDSNAALPEPNQVVKGTITVVATGNIWVADSIFVDGVHDVNGLPAGDNPNFLNLIAQGVIKVVDPGQLSISPSSVTGYTYQPIGILKPGYSGRYLPDPTVVEAAITVGGGGWGAENVDSGSGRRVYSPPMDELYVHGAIAEVLRGVVGLIGVAGYTKHYSYDRRWNPVVNGCSEVITGDLNGDCVVDFEDLEIIAAHWLRNNLSVDEPPICTSPIEGDINNDCKVDFIDLAIMAAHWLEYSLQLE